MESKKDEFLKDMAKSGAETGFFGLILGVLVFVISTTIKKGEKDE